MQQFVADKMLHLNERTTGSHLYLAEQRSLQLAQLGSRQLCRTVGVPAEGSVLVDDALCAAEHVEGIALISIHALWECIAESGLFTVLTDIGQGNASQVELLIAL